MAKVDEEVNAGRARWVRLPKDQLITPRFVVDEGWKRTSAGVWRRKVPASACNEGGAAARPPPQVRCIDDLTASGVNLATSTVGTVHHDGLDAMVAVIRVTADGRRVVVTWRKEAGIRARADWAPACARPSTGRTL